MYTHFRGTTFQFVGQLQNDGVAQDLTNVASLNISVFDKPGVNVFGQLTVNIIQATTGLIDVSYPDTSNWPVGLARIDATLTLTDGTIVASEPDYFRIAQSPMVG